MIGRRPRFLCADRFLWMIPGPPWASAALQPRLSCPRTFGA